MTLPTLYLHIGAHKTGTTSIQRTLFEHSDEIAKAGVLYPQSNLYHWGHHRLGFALKGKTDPTRGDVPDLDVELAALHLAIERESCSRIILSSESLFVCNPDRIARLSKGLKAYDVRVIAFVRRQDNYLLSLWNQHARMIGNGYATRLSQAARAPREISREISYATWIGHWADVFGDEAIRLHRVEDADPLSVILSELGIDPAHSENVQRKNEGMSKLAVEAVLLAKTLALPPRFQRRVRDIALRLHPDGRKPTLTDKQRRAILDTFADENAAMFDRFGMSNTWGTPD